MEIFEISTSNLWGFPTETIARSPITPSENTDRITKLARQGISAEFSSAKLGGRITLIIYVLAELSTIKTDLRVRLDLLHI